jgi:hypothetical protein
MKAERHTILEYDYEVIEVGVRNYPAMGKDGPSVVHTAVTLSNSEAQVS